MSFMEWVGTIAAIWFAASILVAGFWGLAKHRLRKPTPVPPASNVRRIGGEQ